MGVPRLTSLVDNTFTGWQREEIKGNLIVDGYSMCYNLYSFDWGHGGQFPEYREKVARFFIFMKRSDILPIVVMDGIDYKEEKTETILRRRNESVKTVHKHTANMQKRNLEAVDDGVLPSLVFNVFITVMIDLNISFVVADGEGDEWMYKLANRYCCPVLSADSDFLMYKLEKGYIPFNRFHWEASPINAEVYHYRAFCEQNKFQDPSLRLAIPAIAGNDFVTAVDSTKLMSYIARRVGVETRGAHKLMSVVRYLQCYRTLEEFICEIESIVCLDNDEKAQLKSNCFEVQRMYDLDELSTLEEMNDKTDLCTFSSEPIPEWMWKQFRHGNLSPGIVGALAVGKNILNIFIDNTAIDSSTQSSLPIRQFIYGLAGLGLIIEYYRKGLEISGKGIHSIEVLRGHPLPNPAKIPLLTIMERENLLYSILGCDNGTIQGLHSHWKLVMAATVFWARHTNASHQVVKALILSFVVCSTLREELPKMRTEFFIPVEFRRSPKWMPILHSFSQWQSTYTDTISLNQLLMLPLKITSPADLYDGKLAMFFSLPDNVDQLVSMLPIDQQLFGKLVCVVHPQQFSPQYQTPRQLYNQPPRFQNSSRGQQGHFRGQQGHGRGQGRGYNDDSWHPQGSPSDSRSPPAPPTNRGRGRGGGSRRPTEEKGQTRKEGQSNAKSRSRGGGAGVPQAKVVDSKAPKFAHANRYAALMGDEEESDSSSD